MKYCLIGGKLDYSYSKKIHGFMGADYDLIELTPENLRDFVKENKYAGFNVTSPFKEKIVPYLFATDEIAEKIGAVNTVAKNGEKLVGYNTDLFGMEYALNKGKVFLKGKRVLILGHGGAGKTAKVLAQTLGAKSIYTASRKGETNFENCYNIEAEIIINATPVGTLSKTETPIDLKKFASLEGVMDCVYNPTETAFIKQAENLGLNIAYGIDMLVAQAVKAEEIWQEKTFDNGYIERLMRKMRDIIQ